MKNRTFTVVLYKEDKIIRHLSGSSRTAFFLQASLSKPFRFLSVRRDHAKCCMYIAECPEVGTVDQGATIEQAIAGLKEATRLYLEEF